MLNVVKKRLFKIKEPVKQKGDFFKHFKIKIILHPREF